MKTFEILAVAAGVVMLTVAVLMVCTGCAIVRVTTPAYTLTGASMFKAIDIPVGSVGADGAVKVEGYKGNVESQAMGEIIGTAIKTAGVTK